MKTAMHGMRKSCPASPQKKERGRQTISTKSRSESVIPMPSVKSTNWVRAKRYSYSGYQWNMALLNENASTKNTKATKKGELPLRDLRVLRGGLSGRGGSRTHKQSPPSQDGRFAEFAYSTGFS